MNYMQWTPAMSVGLPELDDDHKVLIRVINQLAESIEGNGRPEILRRCVFALLRYAEYHFGREEEVMRACHVPEVAAHREEHQQFIQKLLAIAKNLDVAGSGIQTDEQANSGTAAEPENSLEVSQELIVFLKKWLNHHILTIDMSYRPFVEQNPHASAAAKSFSAANVWWSQ